MTTCTDSVGETGSKIEITSMFGLYLMTELGNKNSVEWLDPKEAATRAYREREKYPEILVTDGYGNPVMRVRDGEVVFPSEDDMKRYDAGEIDFGDTPK